MKAVITNDQGNLSLLKLRLVAEGANDRTLMLLLELQYPMIQRLHSNSGLSTGVLPESLEVPIATPNEKECTKDTVLPLNTVDLGLDQGARIRTAPWTGSSLLGVRLWVLDYFEEWEMLGMSINGRLMEGGGPWDVHPGAIIELSVKRISQGEPFVSHRRFEAFLSKTEAEAMAYRDMLAAPQA